MIIKSIHLKPFAGTIDRRFEFTEGLNVVLGNNEAGKSTLVNALCKALFHPTQLSAAKLREKDIAGYFPANGSDTIRIDLELQSGEVTCCVQKAWGGEAFANVSFPHRKFTQAAEAERELEKYLGITRAGFEHVLICKQADLARTLQNLRDTTRSGGSEAISHLRDMLRQTAFNAGGVSVEKLLQEVNVTVEEYFNNWDREKQYPREGKGIHNKWINKVGHILKAYYTYQDKAYAVQTAKQYDDAVDALQARILSVQNELKPHQEFTEAYREVFDQAYLRNTLQQDLDKLAAQEKSLRNTYEEWTRLQIELETGSRLMQDVQTKTAEAGRLNQEYREAERYEKHRTLLDDLSAAEKVLQQLRATQEALDKLPAVTELVLKQAERIVGDHKLNEAKLIRVELFAYKHLSVTMTNAASKPQTVQIQTGEKNQQAVSGELTIKHVDWEITIRGNSPESLIEIDGKLAQIREEARQLCHTFRIRKFDELPRLHETYKAKTDEIAALKTELQIALKGKPMEDLRQIASELSAMQVRRLPEEIGQELMRLRDTLREAERKIAEKQNWLQDLTSLYQSPQQLLGMLNEVSGKLSHAQHHLSQLTPLPSAYAEADQLRKLVDDFSAHSREAVRLKKESDELEKEEIRLHSTAPDETAETLIGQLGQQKQEFERKLAEGNAYLKIQRQLATLVHELDGDTFNPLEASTLDYFKTMTGEKYSALQMENALPIALQNGVPSISPELLSAGTTDALAIAIRLSMATFYLRDRRGFLIMDDPMVNLDPTRRQYTANCLTEFSSQKQLIVLTCNPDHAQVLGGNLIQL